MSTPPAELSRTPPPPQPPMPTTTPASPQRHSGAYYEDVAPEFDLPGPSSSPHPIALTPGPGPRSPPPAELVIPRGGNGGGENARPSYMGPFSPPPIPDDALLSPDGPNSPGAESSFTSISQRGVNPRWLEAEGMAGGGRGGARVASVGLHGNPDFELPAAMRGTRGRGRGGMGMR